MSLEQIRADLESTNPQNRMRAITALRGCEPEVAVPLLKSKMTDMEVIIRSFVAMGLGRKQTPEGYDALLELLTGDRDPNVRAEAANSLAMYGSQAIPHLVDAFYQNPEWIVRLSIMPVLAEMGGRNDLFNICISALQDQDLTIREEAIAHLANLANTAEAEQILEILLQLSHSPEWRIRRKVALALRKFDDPRARVVLLELSWDEDHRVVGATLENLLPE